MEVFHDDRRALHRFIHSFELGFGIRWIIALGSLMCTFEMHPINCGGRLKTNHQHYSHQDRSEPQRLGSRLFVVSSFLADAAIHPPRQVEEQLQQQPVH
jgi:hypothetical protein